MIVYRICQTYPPDHDPIDGEGAAKYGGRWNSIGVRMIYTASSIALARSELTRHINLEDVPKTYRVYEINIPNQEYLEASPLPTDWDSNLEDDATKTMGDHYFADHSLLAIKVPSVCDPHSYNYLLNPDCDQYHLVKVVKNYPFVT